MNLTSIFKTLQYYLVSILILSSTLSSKNLDFYENSYAVIIGINKYQSESINDLGFAAQDAESMAKLLTTKLQFQSENVKLLLNEEATKNNIQSELFNVADKAEKNDRIFIFYAGHGETFSLKNGGELGYLVPVDGDRENLYVTSISMHEFKSIADMTEAKHILFMVDVCYGGLMALGTRGIQKRIFDSDTQYIKKITSEQARQIITAGGKDDKAKNKY